jgi:para-aminobenzoate synthetase
VKTLIIDNYDSFTFNLYQLIAEVNGDLPTVVRNDADWETLRELAFDNIVISPGPGRPERSSDFGICRRAIQDSRVPMLCVCLGHQGLGHLYGAKVVLAPEPVHGRTSLVYHGESPLFAGIPQGMEVVRYHSLMLARPLPEHIEELAWTRDRIVMAIRHRHRPLWGVQFHPESIGTMHGSSLLRNFRDLTRSHRRQSHSTSAVTAPSSPVSGSKTSTAISPELSVIPRRTHARDARPPGADATYELHTDKLDACPDPEQIFVHLFGGKTNAFWLDSSMQSPTARFHFMGDASGPLSEVLRYDARQRLLTITTPAAEETRKESVFTYLVAALERRATAAETGLPFDFSCGFVGYFGYELKAECGGDDVHPADTPDAYFIFADRILAFDMAENALYLLCLTRAGDADSARRWFAETRAQLQTLGPLPPPRRLPSSTQLQFRLAHDRAQYIDNIASCLQHIRLGESYEVCLTNRIQASADIPPLDYYRTLRRSNPAPYAAFLSLGDFYVACSSPERFLRIDRERWVESKPIKGTLPRGRTPEEDAALREQLRTSEKDRSENLMIVDLVRNDLGVVCEVGTVHVPKYMDVESYATVHQLVSTIRGRLRDDMTAVDCVRAAFPGGSMTGAPKIRTMQIIDALEPGARGVYSGSIGWLSTSGAAELNIVIRTAVFRPQGVSIGVGGAIVALSDTEAEFEETLLKGRALMRAALEMVDMPMSLGVDTPPLEAE